MLKSFGIVFAAVFLCLFVGTSGWAFTDDDTAMDEPVQVDRAGYRTTPLRKRGETESKVPGVPVAALLYTYEGETEFKDDTPDGPGKVDIHEVDFGAPIVFGNLEDWSNGRIQNWEAALSLAAKWNRFDFSEIPGEPIKTEDLYTLAVPVDVMYQGDTWEFYGSIMPGIFSDMQGISSEDFRTMFHALGTYAWKPQLKLSLGLAYDTAFGDDTLYPLAGVIWDVNDSVSMRLVLPWPRILYAPTRKLLFFVDARPAGDNWNLEEEGQKFDFKFEGFRVGAGVEYAIEEHIWLHLSGGASLERKYEIRHSNNTLLDSEADDTYFVRAGIVLR